MRISAFLILLLGLLVSAGCGKSKSTAELLQDMNGQDPDKRHAAVRLLAQHRREAAKVVPALIEALKDKNSEIRHSACLGLGSFGAEAKEAIPALEAARNDQDVRVREAAGKALARIDPK